MPLNKFFKELQRRNVIKAGFSYILTAWIILQVVSIIFPILGISQWVLRMFLYVLIIGFPAWLFFAWVYDITSQGIVKTPNLKDGIEQTINPRIRNHKYIIAGLLILIVLLFSERLINPLTPEQKAFQNIVKNKIAVLPFHNKTGDSTLAPISEMASEWITRGLIETKEAKVVLQNSVIHNLSFISGFNDDVHVQNEFVQFTGAQKIIIGSYFLEKDSIILSSYIIDANDNIPNFVFDLVKGEKSEPSKVINSLKNQIAGYWATRIQTEKSKFHPPLIEAWKMYQKGLKIMSETGDGFFRSEQYFKESTRLDTNFMLPRIELIRIHSYKFPKDNDYHNKLMRLINDVEAKHLFLTDYESNLFNYRKAISIKGDFHTALKFAYENYKIDTLSLLEIYQVVTTAYLAKRPSIAIEVASNIPLATLLDRSEPLKRYYKNSILISLIRSLIVKGKYDKAIGIIQRSKIADYQYYLANIYSYQNANYKLIDMMDSLDIRQLILIGGLNQKLQKDTLAELLLNQALQKSIQSSNKFYELFSLWHLKEYDKAYVLFQNFKMEDMGRSWYYFWKAILLIKQKDFNEAYIVKDALSDESDLKNTVEHSVYLMQQAYIDSALGNLENAMNLLREMDYSNLTNPFEEFPFEAVEMHNNLKHMNEYQHMLKMKNKL